MPALLMKSDKNFDRKTKKKLDYTYIFMCKLFVWLRYIVLVFVNTEKLIYSNGHPQPDIVCGYTP